MVSNESLRLFATVVPPKAPLKIPIKVMPIWVVDKKLLGELISLKAALALAFPSFAHWSNRTLRAEIIASSDMAKIPLAIMSKMMKKASKAREDIFLGQNDFMGIV
jgi:hypothetical protein